MTPLVGDAANRLSAKSERLATRQSEGNSNPRSRPRRSRRRQSLVRALALDRGREQEAVPARGEPTPGHEPHLRRSVTGERVPQRAHLRRPRRREVLLSHLAETAHRLDVREALQLARVVRVVLRRSLRTRPAAAWPGSSRELFRPQDRERRAVAAPRAASGPQFSLLSPA